MSEYPDNWDALRQQVYQRDGFECQNCGCSPKDNSDPSLHAHHVVPIAKGGVNRMSNLITLCSDCHGAAHGEKMAPTYSPKEHNETLDSFNSVRRLRCYLDSKYCAEEVVEKILSRLDLDSPISHEELTQIEREVFQDWFSRNIDGPITSPFNRRIPKKYEYLSAVEIENLRE